MRQVDHTLYQEYTQDPEPEPFQKHFIKWYETGGSVSAPKAENEKLKAKIESLRSKYTVSEMARLQKQISFQSFVNLTQENYFVAESTARVLISDLNKL